MGVKRQPSISTILTRAAKKGVAMRATLPDGTIIENLTFAQSTASSGRNDSEWEKALNAVSTGAVRSRGRR